MYKYYLYKCEKDEVEVFYFLLHDLRQEEY